MYNDFLLLLFQIPLLHRLSLSLAFSWKCTCEYARRVLLLCSWRYSRRWWGLWWLLALGKVCSTESVTHPTQALIILMDRVCCCSKVPEERLCWGQTWSIGALLSSMASCCQDLWKHGVEVISCSLGKLLLVLLLIAAQGHRGPNMVNCPCLSKYWVILGVTSWRGMSEVGNGRLLCPLAHALLQIGAASHASDSFWNAKSKSQI